MLSREEKLEIKQLGEIEDSITDIFEEYSGDGSEAVRYRKLAGVLRVVEEIYDNKDFYFVHSYDAKAVKFMILLENLRITSKDNRRCLYLVKANREKYGKREEVTFPAYFFTDYEDDLMEKIVDFEFIVKNFPYIESLYFEPFTVFMPTSKEIMEEWI